MPDDTKTLRVYTLGQGFPTKTDGTPLYSWPLDVKYAPDRRGSEFYLAEGDARNGFGSFFPAADILDPKWHSHLETSETLWLVPLLERLACGQSVPPDEILAAYCAVHGEPPLREEWALP